MSDEDTKLHHSKRRKRNMMDKYTRDTGDYKGPFAIKPPNPKRPEYKREKLHINDILKQEETEW